MACWQVSLSLVYLGDTKPYSHNLEGNSGANGYSIQPVTMAMYSI